MSHILSSDIEAQTLALLTMKMIGDAPVTSVAFEVTLPAAYKCLQAARKFLATKEEEAEKEAEAEAEKFWASEAGLKKQKEIETRFARLKKERE